jgi:hypothetical protein
MGRDRALNGPESDLGRPGWRLFAASTRVDGFPSTHATALTGAAPSRQATLCFVDTFLNHASPRPTGTGIASIQANPLTKECIMKLQFGQNQLVLELSSSPFAWFHGQTERMSLTSLSLMFVQFSLFARQPAA